MSAHLLGLLPSGGPERASAAVYRDGALLRIELSATGEETQQRALPSQADCDASAELAAYVIAAWLDVMPVGTVKAPGIPPRERPPLEVSSRLHLFDEPLAIDATTLLGAAVLTETDTLGTAVGGLISVGMPSLVEQSGWVLESSLTSSREFALGQGTVSARRATFTGALTYDFYRTAWAVRGQLGVALGVLWTSGSGYATNNAATSLMWALDMGLALVHRSRGREAWLGLAALGWPQNRSVVTRVVGAGDSLVYVAMPSWDLRLVLGYSFARL